jgi:Uncharacterized protein conserved in bacteria
VDFEWDPEKNRANLRKHGIDFEDAREVFEGAYLEGPDERFFGAQQECQSSARLK